MKTTKRLLALVMAFVMVIGMMPVGHVHAAEDNAFTSEKLTGLTGTASSVDTSEAAYDKSVTKAFDGNTDTFWATVPDGNLANCYLIADLGGEYLINKIEYTKRIYNSSYDCTGNLLNYVLQYTTDETVTDDTEWKPLASGDTVNGTTAITFDPVEATYVKLTSTSSYHWQAENANTVMTCAEFAVYKAVCEEHTYDNACDADCNVCGATRTTAHAYDNAFDTTCNVCGATRAAKAFTSEKLTGLTGTASSNDAADGSNIEEAFDGITNDASNYWASVKNDNGIEGNEYLIANLGGEYLINQVVYHSRTTADATGNLKDYVIWVSTDGEHYEQVTSGDIETLPGATTITFDPIRATHVKLTATQSAHWQDANLNKVMAVAEFEVYKAVCEEHDYDDDADTECNVCGAVRTIEGGGEGGEGDGHNYTNGFCTDADCGAYQPAVLNAEGVYEISNGGQLYWFMELVNAGTKDANAVLTENITVNPGTFGADGAYTAAAGEAVRNWVAMGASTDEYVGTFDGNNKSISGLYLNNTEGHVGFISYLGEGGMVKNLTISNSYFGSSGMTCGGIVAVNQGTVTGCTNNAIVKSTNSNVGGIVGSNSGTVTDCTNTGSVTSSYNYVGGIVGTNSGTISGCTNSGAVTAASIAGGIAGKSTGDVEDCVNSGDIVANSSIGGIVGEASCNITRCGNSGTIGAATGTTLATGAGGIVGKGGASTTPVISQCYNTGTINAKNTAGGIAGEIGGTANVGNTSTAIYMVIEDCYNTGNVNGVYNNGGNLGGVVGSVNNADSSVENCYNTGTVKPTGSYAASVGGVAGKVASATSIDNCYYESGCAKDGKSKVQNGIGNKSPNKNTADVEGSTAGKTDDQFASGEVTWLLNGETDQGELVWKQTIGSDVTPDFDGEVVHNVEGSDVFYNGDEPPHVHTYGEPEFVWAEDNSASAKFTCTEDATHVETVDATVTSTATGDGCDDPVVTTYTATVTFEGQTYTDTKEKTTAATGHNYGVPVFVWAEDNTATATMTCTNNAEHVVTLDVTVTSETTEGNCTTPATTKYTATAQYGDDTYTDVKTVTADAPTHTYDNGFCTACDAYEPAKLNEEGVYEISNGGQLYWFATLVNGGDTDANAVLMNDITVNPGTFAADGTYTAAGEETVRNWVPIGSITNQYVGTFDGNEHDISGLYLDNNKSNYVGLFGYLGTGAAVKDTGIENTYFYGKQYVGAISGYNLGTISGCSSAARVRGANVSNTYVGGITGYSIGEVTDCTNSGTVSGFVSVGGMVGYNYGLITDCVNNGPVTYEGTSGGAKMGGIAGFSGFNRTYQGGIYRCTNTADVTGSNASDGQVGGIVGSLSGNGNHMTPVQECVNTGNVTGCNKVGGLVGYCSIATVENSYNTGDVTAVPTSTGYYGDKVGGVAGMVTSTLTVVDNCYSTGDVNGKELVGGAIGYDEKGAKITDCFYLADSETDELDGTAAKTEAQFASGEVTWLLNGETDQGELVWKQTIGTNDAPQFDGSIVHQGYESCGGTGFTNNADASAERPEHTDEGHDHVCDICGENVGEHVAAEGSHICEYCNKPASECTDDATDGDHNCDICGEPIEGAECIDTDKNHECDDCKGNVGEHVAAEGSHDCDYCGEPVTECTDDATDGDHNCDICGEPIEDAECTDEDKDHKCDDCKGNVGEHVAAEGSHDCDYCGEPVTECTDEDKDHACDVCGENVGKHEDTNKDHKCDYGCSESIGVCEDKDNDGKCDYGCDKEFEVKPTEPDPTDPEPTEPDVTEPDPTEPDPTEPDATEPEAPKTEGVTRLAGENRLVTSELIANQLKEKMGVEKFQNIIVASGGTFADALPGSYLAAVKNAPIVLTLAKQKYIDQTATYIKANLAEGGTVYILGGESAVPKLMEEALVGINVKRVAGADRFGTNLAILKEAGVKSGDEILVCTAKEFADSLSAAATGKPILLVYKKITDEQKTYLGTLSGCKFTVVGGTTAVPENLEEAMKAYGEVSRLAGKDRLDTSILVAKKYFPDATSSVVAYGWDFPDGLCGGSLAYATKSPLILAHSKEKLAQFTADYTVKAGLKAGYVLGGDGLVDDAATRTIFGMGNEPIILIK